MSYGVLSNPNYRLFFLGQLISAIGSSAQIVVEALLIYRMTQSTFLLAAINFCALWAACLSSPVAGVMADRFNRRTLLILVTLLLMLQAVLLGMLFFAGMLGIWQMAGLAIALGIANAFEMSTRHVFAADLVGRAEIVSAIGLNSVALNLGRCFGPPVAGLLFSIAGTGQEGWGFFFNALTFVVVLIGLQKIRQNTLFVNNEISSALAVSRPALISELRSGIEYAGKTLAIRKMLIFMAVLSFVAGSYMVLYPSIATQLLRNDTNVLELLSSATGVGSLFGALNLTRASMVSGLVWRKFVNNVMLLGASFVILGFSTSLCLSLCAAFGIGFFLFTTYPLANVAIQEQVDEQFRGRIVSLLPMTYLGAASVGGLLLGLVTDLLGLSFSATLIGAACSILSLVAQFKGN